MSLQQAKVYLITRTDLPLGQRAVQLAHAIREWSERYPAEDRVWYQTSNTLALLEVPDELALQRLLKRANLHGIPAAPFQEPDRDNELTAVAFGPTAKKLCRRLPLAFA